MEIINRYPINDILWDCYICLVILSTLIMLFIALPMLCGYPRKKNNIKRQLNGGFILSVALTPFVSTIPFIFSLYVAIIISFVYIICSYFLYISCAKEIVEENHERMETHSKYISFQRNIFLLILSVALIITFILIYTF